MRFDLKSWLIVSNCYENIKKNYRFKDNAHILQSLLLVMEEYNKRLEINTNYKKIHDTLEQKNFTIFGQSERLWDITNMIYSSIKKDPKGTKLLSEINNIKSNLWIGIEDLMKIYSIFHDIGNNESEEEWHFWDSSNLYFYQKVLNNILHFIIEIPDIRISKEKKLIISDIFEEIDISVRDFVYEIKLSMEEDHSINDIQKIIDLKYTFKSTSQTIYEINWSVYDLSAKQLSFINIYKIYNTILSKYKSKYLLFEDNIKEKLKNLFDTDIIKIFNEQLSFFSMWENIIKENLYIWV